MPARRHCCICYWLTDSDFEPRIDQHAAQRLRSVLRAVLDSGARYLTVDLAGMNGCDENVLDVLSWAACRASLQEGWLALDGVNHHIRFAAQ